MESTLEREVRRLRVAVAVLGGCVFVLMVVTLLPYLRHRRFGEIDVERINVVEPDGQLKMVISDQARQHPGIVNGKLIQRDGPRPPGILFFNQLGDEMGGLVYGENGGDGHFGSLTFDKVRGDQTIGFRHLESDGGAYATGLEMWQQPDIPSDVMLDKYHAASAIADATAREAAIQALRDANELTARRLYLGKLRDDAMILQMSDIQGHPRVTIKVPAKGAPRLDFLDDEGKVTYSLPSADGSGSPH